MKQKYLPLSLIIFSLFAVSQTATGQPNGAKGQNFDRLVFETPQDGATLTARVMTVNRFVDSASQITIVDNGAEVFGPETSKTERWSREVAIRGAGRHEVVLLCRSLNSAPVYCQLSLDDAQARVIE